MERKASSIPAILIWWIRIKGITDKSCLALSLEMVFKKFSNCSELHFLAFLSEQDAKDIVSIHL